MRGGGWAENILAWKTVEAGRVEVQDQEITAAMVHCPLLKRIAEVNE